MLNIRVDHGTGYLLLCKNNGMFLSSVHFQVHRVLKG